MATWMLTGGAGYIGAHIARALLDEGLECVVLDDLSGGYPENIPAGVPLVEGTILDQPLVERTLRNHDIDGVVHLAAKKAVGESVERPLWYYEQNVVGTHHLLEAMDRTGVEKLLFSSSAATYGETGIELVNEESPTMPASPYGETKLVSEWMIRDQGRATNLSYACLRYFNVAGAGAPELGDRAAANLIPMVFRALSNGERPQVFGADYQTRDGSGLRDYIHVVDLARAHAMVASFIATKAKKGTQLERVYNVGTGTGTTVFEVMDAVRDVTGIEFDPEIVARRPGDVAKIIASADRIRRDVGWEARLDVVDMVRSAWASWQLRNPAH